MDGDERMMEYSEMLFGYPIRCSAERLDSGVHVLLTGGCRSHIGAVSIAEPGKAPVTTVFPGHKDQFISEPWAKALAEKIGQRACVVCGIHYDNAAGEQIEAVMQCADALLAQLLQTL